MLNILVVTLPFHHELIFLHIGFSMYSVNQNIFQPFSFHTLMKLDYGVLTYLPVVTGRGCRHGIYHNNLTNLVMFGLVEDGLGCQNSLWAILGNSVGSHESEVSNCTISQCSKKDDIAIFQIRCYFENALFSRYCISENFKICV